LIGQRLAIRELASRPAEHPVGRHWKVTITPSLFIFNRIAIRDIRVGHANLLPCWRALLIAAQLSVNQTVKLITNRQV
jgi:hypothetical protein